LCPEFVDRRSQLMKIENGIDHTKNGKQIFHRLSPTKRSSKKKEEEKKLFKKIWQKKYIESISLHLLSFWYDRYWLLN
jgi:DNA-directed RNA polymerase beta' subunit